MWLVEEYQRVHAEGQALAWNAGQYQHPDKRAWKPQDFFPNYMESQEADKVDMVAAHAKLLEFQSGAAAHNHSRHQ